MANASDLIRYQPFGRITPRKLVRLDVNCLHPVIHIAHRRRGPLSITDRFILDHELVLFLKGRGRFVIDGEAHAIAPHVLFCVPPYVPHSIEAGGTVEHVAIHFDMAGGLPQLSRRTAYEIRMSHELSLPHRVELQPADGIEERCISVVNSFSAIDPMASIEATAGLSQVLIGLMRIRPEPSGGDGQARIRALVEQAITLIESSVVEKITTEDVAGKVGLSESHLNRVFRQQTGYAPMEYARRYRVQKAKELLGDLTLSVKEIAHRTGFDDAYHFSRVFRQIAGVPPTSYRDALLSRQQP